MGLNKCERKDNMYITIIIPVFNQSHTIKKCMDSILLHEEGIEKEIILINDGSTDDSDEICRKYENEHAEVKYFYQENKGVSAARNLGIRNAKGKYIFYLDADDELETGTISKVSSFFESVEDEVDMVTYKINTIYNGKILKPHFRYKYLTESKVYDLCTMPYIGQTTMNIVVKNKYEKNIMFDEKQTFSEDQRYCCDVLKDKLKIGYCEEGAYIYYRSENSSSGRLSGSCYIFEQCTKFFEELFEQYDDVPKAFQGLFVNDFAWKLCTNILLPYHYDNELYDISIGRLKKLLEKCENSVIIEHPQIDFFEKYYMLRMKENSEFYCKVDNNGYRLVSNGKCYITERKMEIVLTRVCVEGSKVVINGFLKTVFFQFYKEKPTFCAVENDGKVTRKINLYKSAHNYYMSREETQRFWAFSYVCDTNEVKKVRFKVEVGEYWFPVKYYFMPLIPFSHSYKKYTYRSNGIDIKINNNNEFLFKYGTANNKKKVWLYYDCSGVVSDNGMTQFLNDYRKKDNIDRYYIVTDERQRELLPDKKCAIEFGSYRHKRKFLNADKIITAYIEEANIIPYPREEYEKYADRFKFEVIYLQHGVLHIDMPWKYTPERIMAGRVVVSTVGEAELFVRNGFSEEKLIRCRMPRFSKKEKKISSSKKILLAPSWRMYLVGGYKDHKWMEQKNKFLGSTYYKKLCGLLESNELHTILKNNGYTLEVKLHPIFTQYAQYFDIKSEYIKIVEQTGDIAQYDLFITDFSSFMYDFLYQNIPVLLYLPDVCEFKSGMNGYRAMGDNEQYWKLVCTEESQLVEKIKGCIEDRVYDNIKADFYEGDNPCETIYKEIIG